MQGKNPPFSKKFKIPDKRLFKAKKRPFCPVRKKAASFLFRRRLRRFLIVFHFYISAKSASKKLQL
jgi:hypothetical protein